MLKSAKKFLAFPPLHDDKNVAKYEVADTFILPAGLTIELVYSSCFPFIQFPSFQIATFSKLGRSLYFEN